MWASSWAYLTIGTWLLHFSQVKCGPNEKLETPYVVMDDVIGSRDVEACSPGTRPKLLTDYSGWFTSSNYPANYDNSATCSWLIESQEKTVALQFVDFYTESGYDQVLVYNGNSTTGYVLANLAGPTMPTDTYYSFSTQMLLVFTTDSSVAFRGFNVTYTSSDFELPPDACDVRTRPMVLTGYSGTFQSNGFPVAYPNNANCQWRFVAQEADGTVEITFDMFATEGRYDYARVYDGDSASAPLLGEVHGNPPMPPTIFQSTQRYLFLQFTSDGTVSNPGFNGSYATVSAIYGPCGSILHVAPAEASPVPPYDQMCYLNRDDVDYLNVQCYDLIRSLPNIGHGNDLIAQGGNFGCYMTADTSFDSARSACYDNFQWSTTLGSCVTCQRMFVCIRYDNVAIQDDPPRII